MNDVRQALCSNKNDTGTQAIGGNAVCSELRIGGGQPPAQIELMPVGMLNAVDGRRWFLENPENIIAASIRAKTKLAIDREHERFYGGPLNSRGAAGWIDSMFVRDGSIWADVTWTPAAAKQIADLEYRYVSPEFKFDAATGRVLQITGASIVTNPALELQALAHAQPLQTQLTTKEETQDMIKIAEALGLKAGAGEDAILAALSALKTDVTAATGLKTAVCASLSVEANADQAAITKAIDDLKSAKAAASAAGNPDPSRYVPIAQFDELKGQVAALSKQAGDKAADEAVASAIRAGKVTPAQKDWAMAYASKDLAGFGKYVEASPVIVQPAGTGAASVAGQVPAQSGSLTNEDIAVCKQLGINPDDLKKTNQSTGA